MNLIKEIIKVLWAFFLLGTFFIPVIPALLGYFSKDIKEAMRDPELLPHEIHVECLKCQKRSRQKCFQGHLNNCEDEIRHLETSYDSTTYDDARRSLVSCCTSGVFNDSLCDKWESDIIQDLNAGSVKVLNRYSNVLGHRGWKSYAEMNSLEVELLSRGARGEELPLEVRRFYDVVFKPTKLNHSGFDSLLPTSKQTKINPSGFGSLQSSLGEEKNP